MKAAVKDVIPLENYHLLFVQGTSMRWVAEMLCNLKSEEDVNEFVANYLRENNETIMILTRKPCGDKSPYVLNDFYRCQHHTRYKVTRDSATLKANNLMKRIKKILVAHFV